MENPTLVVIGLGSQATAWALNLRDSGYNIIVALRKNSPTINRAAKLSFDVIELSTKELSNYKHFFLLIPDSSHKDFFNENLEFIDPESSIYYAHGHSYLEGNFKDLYPGFSHFLLAPKAIASEVRHQYQMEGKLGAVYSVEAISKNQQESARKWITKLSTALGITALFESSFQEETYADLFSEQTILCSLLPYGALHSFNKLIEKGISPEVAYMECWLEVKLIASAMLKHGPEGFFKLISPNALIGGEKAKELIFNKDYQNKLDKLADDIWSGKFFTECKETDSTKLRTKVLRDWSKEKLTKVHNQIKESLIDGPQ